MGNAADIFPELVRRGVRPDFVTDQTSLYDPLNGYIPNAIAYYDAMVLRASDLDRYIAESYRSIGEHLRAMLDFHRMGVPTFDYGNNIRAQAKEHAGVENAFDFPGFVPAYIRPLFAKERDLFAGWRSPAIRPTSMSDRAILEIFPEDKPLARWIKMAQERIAFQGLPARICWLGYGERKKRGSNSMN